MHSEIDIQKLLQLKRHETPPSGFHEDFLAEFRRRQRMDLMRRTLLGSFWQMLAERLSDSLSHSFTKLRVPAVAYASIAVIGVLTSTVILTRQPGGASAFHSSISSNEASVTNFSPVTPVEIPRQRAVGTTLPPHYVLENRPASYEAPLSF